MAGRVLVFAEQRDGRFRKSAFEAIGRARELGAEVHAVIAGDKINGLAPELGRYGAKVVHVAEDPALAKYWSDGYAAVLAQAIEVVQPDLVIMIATAMGKDLAPRVAARKGMAILTDCISLDPDGEVFQAVKSMYGGKVFARVRAQRLPVLATLRPSAYPAPQPGADGADARPLAVSLPADSRGHVIEIVTKDEGRPDVQEAEIVVTGGRGLKEPANFKMLEELADTLRAAVGASRAAVDAGWIDHSHQVGQTGKTVSPKLYVAVGVSGAIQHLAGMRTSKCILAINKDPEAPIFSIADYGIVGDLFKVVPVLTRELAGLKG